MDSRDLECFHMLYRLGSMAATANELGISRQTLSSAIARVEMEAGTRLFVRNKTGCVPTPAGQIFEKQLERFDAEWTDMLEVVRQAGEGAGRTLHFGCNIAYLTRGISSAIGHFREQHPQIKVATEHSPDYEHLWKGLTEGKLDLAITGDIPPELDLPFAAVGRGDVYLCMSAHHCLAKRNTIQFPDDLVGQRLVTCISGGTQILARYGIEPDYTVPSLSAVIELVAEGTYMSLSPDQYLCGYLERGCVALPLQNFPMKLRSCIVRRNETDALVNELADTIREQMTS